MTLPKTLVVQKEPDERRRLLDSIARDAERERRAFHFKGTIRPGKSPRFLIAFILGLIVLGGAVMFAARNSVERRVPRDKEAAAREGLHAIAMALTLYYEHTGHYPQFSEMELVALYADPGTDGWRGPYITAHPNDPWNRPFIYIPHGATNLPALFSCGPDRNPDTDDDIHASPDDFIVPPEILQSWRRFPTHRTPSIQILDCL